MTEILISPCRWAAMSAVWAQDATSQAASVEFPPHMLRMNARRRGCGGERGRHLASGQPRKIPRGRPHGGGGCSHRLRAQVLGGAVIKFLVNLSKTQTSSASMNGRRIRQRDAGRAVLISSQRQIQSLPSKKQLRVWIRHKSAGIIRLPLRHQCRCRHRRRTEENPRTSPCTALSCL